MPEGTEEAVVEALRGLGGDEPVPGGTEVVDAVRGRVACRHRRRRVRQAAGLAAVGAVTLILGAALIVGDVDDGTDLDVQAPATTEPTTTTAPGPATPEVEGELPKGFALLPPPPLAPRTGAAVAEVNGSIVVWGGGIEGASTGHPELGDEAYADGATYDPATGTWTPMPTAPLPASQDLVRSTVDGGRLVIARGTSVAAWDASTGAWDDLPDLDDEAGELVAVDGTIVALGPGGRVLRPGAEDWTPVDDPPLALDAYPSAWSAVAADDEVIAVISGPAGVPAGSEEVWAAALDPSGGTWRQLPPGPFSGSSFESALDAAWTGEEVVVVGYGMTAAAYRPADDTWRALPSLPVSFNEGVPQGLSVGGQIVVERLPAIVALEGDRWSPSPWPWSFPCCALAPGADGRIWVGTWGALDPTGTKLGIISTTVLRDPPVVLLGDVRLTLGPDHVLRSAELVDPGALTPTGVTARVATSPVDDCTVEVGLPSDPSAADGVTGRDEAGGEAVVEGRSGGYPFTVTCPALADAEDLAGRLTPNPSPWG